MNRSTANRLFFRVLLGVFLASGLVQLDAGDPGLRGKPAPAFELEMIGSRLPVALGDYRGRVVLMDFWASWCAPCKKSLPELADLASRFPGLRVLAVNIDDKRENALAFMRDAGVDLTVLYDGDKEVVARYDVAEMPTAVLIDRQGVVREVFAGYTEADIPDIVTAVRDVLEP